MTHISQVNYDEASLISKGLHSDGDDIVQLHSRTRQKVHALRSEWVGDAADAFFEEMDSELLPALQRVSGALFLGEEILNKIMKLIHEADEETAQLFKNDFGGDFGAGLFGAAVGAALGSAVVGGDDFGASGFQNALSPEGSGAPSTGAEGEIGAPTESPPMNTNPTMDMQPPSSQETPPAETPTTETTSGGGGGGGGGGSSQGLQGDLKGLGTGVGGVAQQSGAGGGAPGMPDHIYEGSSGGATGGSSAPSGPVSGGGAPEQSSGGGIAGVAGAAGVLGAAAAGAAKVLKNDSDETGE